MRRLLLVLVLVACKKAEPTEAPAPKPVTAAKPAAAPIAVGWIEADPAGPLDATLAEQAALAVANGKKPHAYLHADWCGPCVEIEKTRDADPKMKAAFAGTHVIAIDIDRVDEKQIEAAGMRAAVLPIFYRLDDKGRPTGATIDGGAWGDNIPDNMAPPLAAFFAK